MKQTDLYYENNKRIQDVVNFIFDEIINKKPFISDSVKIISELNSINETNTFSLNKFIFKINPDADNRMCEIVKTLADISHNTNLYILFSDAMKSMIEDSSVIIKYVSIDDLEDIPQIQNPDLDCAFSLSILYKNIKE